MFKVDVAEAKPIVERAMQRLLLTFSSRGRPGSDARTAIGAMLARLEELLHDDTIGEPLATCFDLARKAGTTVHGIRDVYGGVVAETPSTLGGNLMKNALLTFCCANSGRIIADMTFTNRDEAERIKLQVNATFSATSEIAADAMDSTTYVAMVSLHAATTHFLVETARPLPRILAFRFAAPLSTLVAAHKLYDDAARGDELREENEVVHPAFMRPAGRALSA